MSFDFCGAVVGTVRSFYDAPARLEAGGPVASIRFYVAPVGAVWYPHPHVFLPRSQELQFQNDSLGEITNAGRRTWYRGTTPTGVRGTHYDITPEQALGLQRYTGPTPSYLVPLCRLPLRIGLAAVARERTERAALGLSVNGLSLFRPSLGLDVITQQRAWLGLAVRIGRTRESCSVGLAAVINLSRRPTVALSVRMRERVSCHLGLAAFELLTAVPPGGSVERAALGLAVRASGTTPAQRAKLGLAAFELLTAVPPGGSVERAALGLAVRAGGTVEQAAKLGLKADDQGGTVSQAAKLGLKADDQGGTVSQAAKLGLTVKATGVAPAQFARIGLKVIDSPHSGGGTPVTGHSVCTDAEELPLPYSAVHVQAAGQTLYWKISVVSGTTYHMRITPSVGSPGTATLFGGSCGFRSPTPISFTSFPNCASFVAAATGTMWVQVVTGVSGSTFTLEVGTGGC